MLKGVQLVSLSTGASMEETWHELRKKNTDFDNQDVAS